MALAVLVWGAPIVVLLVGVIATVLVFRWRRRAIAAMERAELEADAGHGEG
ncbi:hypothetical protein [Streptomyces amakusaensis]|uniref:Secreted protein n=1 Tax=Streptomyces amakusaensis TaxID=67271 RepID=A0ABW0AUG0_9ACTN